jgi:methionyl-tRNA formyltransferase
MRIAVICNDRLGLPALQQLVQNRLVQAVATSDRSPEMMSIMKLVTQQGGVPSHVFTRKNFDNDLIDWLKKYQPDVVLVKTFPFRIPAAALLIPKYGFINFHYAPLPEYRGSNPLFWMIRNGIRTGGVAVHSMDENFDTGPILLQEAVEFPAGSNFGICSTILGHTGAKLSFQLLHQLQSGVLKEIPQDKNEHRWYGRPGPADLFIQWKTMTSAEIMALINACNPWLKGAPTRWKVIPINIVNASLSEFSVPPSTVPGTVLHISEKEGLIISCKDEKAIRAEVMYLEEGFFPGWQLSKFGLIAENRFD